MAYYRMINREDASDWTLVDEEGHSGIVLQNSEDLILQYIKGTVFLDKYVLAGTDERLAKDIIAKKLRERTKQRTKKFASSAFLVFGLVIFFLVDLFFLVLLLHQGYS